MDPYRNLVRGVCGRTKRELVEQMVYRSPHSAATEKLVQSLEPFPLLLLALAVDFPTQIWILDRGERPSSAQILDDRVRNMRWHSAGLTIDQCDGITEVVDGAIAMVVSWKTRLIMRHEFGHVLTTFFPPRMRQKLGYLYQQAKQHGRLLEPLAGESIGEYAACALGYYFFPDLRQELRQADPALFALVDQFLARAEAQSHYVTAPGPVAPLPG